MASKQEFDAYLKEHDAANYDREGHTYPDKIEQFAQQNGYTWEQAQDNVGQLRQALYKNSQGQQEDFFLFRALKKFEAFLKSCGKQIDSVFGLSRAEIDAQLDEMLRRRRADRAQELRERHAYACCYVRVLRDPQYDWDRLPHEHICEVCGKSTAENGEVPLEERVHPLYLQARQWAYDRFYNVYQIMKDMGYDVKLVYRCSACVHGTHLPAMEFHFRMDGDEPYTVTYPELVYSTDVERDRYKTLSPSDYIEALHFLTGQLTPTFMSTPKQYAEIVAILGMRCYLEKRPKDTVGGDDT